MCNNLRKKGFTLIELLVVIAIIALLLAILMPSLKKAKKAGGRIQCLANIKTLSTAYMVYVGDYDGKMPRCGTGKGSWVNRTKENTKDQIRGVKNGVLWPYVEDLEVYRCPVAKADRYDVKSYAISTAMNWSAGPVPISHGGEVVAGKIIRNFTQIRNTSSRMLFVCHYFNDKNASWLVPAAADFWFDAPGIQHGSGGNVFSFADGHSEFHDWKDQRTIKMSEDLREGLGKTGNAVGEQADNEDLIWAAKAQWGKIRKDSD